MMCSTQMIVMPSSRRMRSSMSAAWSISVSSSPPRLSSARRSVGWVASALASSSFFRPAAPSSPTSAFGSFGRRTASIARSAASHACVRLTLPPWPKYPASATFSRMVSRRKGRGIWNVRPMPMWQIRSGDRPPISRLSSRIDPAVGFSVPETMLKMVLLPDPFGPMRPRISPFATSKDTSFTAVKPPKRFVSPATESIATSCRERSAAVPVSAPRRRAPPAAAAPARRRRSSPARRCWAHPSRTGSPPGRSARSARPSGRPAD